MHSLIVLASRPPDWSEVQFIEWWRGPHADLAKKLPGLREYLHGAVETAYDERSAGWDAYARLAFDSREALDAAMTSEEWRVAMGDAAGMRGKRIAMIVSEVDLLAPAPSKVVS
jgi:uncharacterized protein (TIGR02118 family)